MSGLRTFAISLVFVILTPYVYSEATSYWRSLPAPLQGAFLFESVALGYALAFLSEVAGAAIAAFMLALPFTWLVRRKPLFLALFLWLAASITLLPDLYFLVRFSQVRIVIVQLPALVSFFFLSWFFAALATKGLRQHAA